METIIEQYSFFERWKIYLLLKIFIHEIQWNRVIYKYIYALYIDIRKISA